MTIARHRKFTKKDGRSFKKNDYGLSESQIKGEGQEIEIHFLRFTQL